MQFQVILALFFAQVLFAAPMPAEQSADENHTGVWAVNEELDNNELNKTNSPPRTHEEDVAAAHTYVQPASSPATAN